MNITVKTHLIDTIDNVLIVVVDEESHEEAIEYFDNGHDDYE